MLALRTLVVLAAAAAFGCNQRSAPSPAPADPAAADQPADVAAAAPREAATTTAELGKPAPDFSLTALDGGPVSLSQHKGKTVVLEWFNPDCPFVRQAHSEGDLKGMAGRYEDKQVVWLAINSGAPGKQGASEETNRAGRERYGIDYPILMDPDGAVGRRYDAKRTPHMYVIDPAGTLVYRGAIDNSMGGDAEDVKLVNYVANAIDDVAAGKPVRRAETPAWGCSVKYARN